MPPNNSNDESAYKGKIKLYVNELKHGGIQAAKFDLTKISIRNHKRNRCVKRKYKLICIYSLQRDSMRQMVEQLIC